MAEGHAYYNSMKSRNTFITVVFTAVVCLILKSGLVNSSIVQPAAGNDGAPNTIPPNQTCAQCHSGGGAQQNAVPNVAFSFSDGVNDVPVANFEYELNKQYTITYRPLTTSKRYGFQMSAITATNANGGNFALTDPTHTTLVATPTKYVSHHNASSFHNWTFSWTAPSTNVGDITFYYVFNASDSSDTETGDTIYVGHSVVHAAATTGIVENAFTHLAVYPNPATDVLNVSFQLAGSLTAEVNLFTANGQWIKNIALYKAGNLISQAVNVQDLPAGIYLLQIKSGQNSICKKVAVQ